MLIGLNVTTMRKPDAPCKDCNKRSATCHSNCELYIKFTKDKEIYKNSISGEKSKERKIIEDFKYRRNCMKSRRASNQFNL